MTLKDYKDFATTTWKAREAFDLLKKDGWVTVAVAGFKFEVCFVEGEAVAAFPKAKAASRAFVFQLSGNQFDTLFSIYSPKLKVSVDLLMEAMASTRGVDEFLIKVSQKTDRCSICGANLTDPISTSRGIGPECIKKVALSSPSLFENRQRYNYATT